MIVMTTKAMIFINILDLRLIFFNIFQIRNFKRSSKIITEKRHLVHPLFRINKSGDAQQQNYDDIFGLRFIPSRGPKVPPGPGLL
jgi:hypothetical protein